METPPVEYAKLSAEADEESSVEIRQKVLAARERAAERFAGTQLTANAQMRLPDLKTHVRLSDSVKRTLALAHSQHRLSARSYHRLIKVSSTIADLDASPEITGDHVAEALHYRPKQEI